MALGRSATTVSNHQPLETKVARKLGKVIGTIQAFSSHYGERLGEKLLFSLAMINPFGATLNQIARKHEKTCTRISVRSTLVESFGEPRVATMEEQFKVSFSKFYVVGEARGAGANRGRSKDIMAYDDGKETTTIVYAIGLDGITNREAFVANTVGGFEPTQATW